MAEDEPSRAVRQDPIVGQVVGNKYRVLRLCGRGGMGSVYEAQNLALGKRVALKFIDSEACDHDGVQRFMREAQAASAAESQHIVQVFDFDDTSQGRPYIVMELLRGETLAARLERVGRLSTQQAVHIAVQVLRGLHRAHQVGVVHRDLKPENVFLTETDDEPLFAKIVDFGISKIARCDSGVTADTLTQKGVILGTPFYMSPEQAQAAPDVDARTDLWALGAILFECLTGRRAFVGDTYQQVIIGICTRDAPDVRELAPETPESLAHVIAQALARDRDKRFQCATDFIEALRQAVPEAVTGKTDPACAPTQAISGVTSDSSCPAPQTQLGTADHAPAQAGSGRVRASVVIGVVVAAAGLALGCSRFGRTTRQLRRGWLPYRLPHRL